MKANKIISLFGIMFLMSNSMILGAALSNKSIRPALTQGTVAKTAPIINDTHESSDEEIMAGHQFTGPVHERTRHGLPKLKKTAPSWNDIRDHYWRWATVDKQGAASEFKPIKK